MKTVYKIKVTIINESLDLYTDYIVQDHERAKAEFQHYKMMVHELLNVPLHPGSDGKTFTTDECTWIFSRYDDQHFWITREYTDDTIRTCEIDISYQEERLLDSNEICLLLEGTVLKDINDETFFCCVSDPLFVEKEHEGESLRTSVRDIIDMEKKVRIQKDNGGRDLIKATTNEAIEYYRLLEQLH